MFCDFMEWLRCNVFPLVLVVGVLLVIMVVYQGCQESHRCRVWAVSQGYDENDVDVFLDTGNWSFDDFKKSQSLRLQYAQWKDGIISEELARAQAKAKADDSRNQGFATGIAAGVAVSQSSK